MNNTTLLLEKFYNEDSLSYNTERIKTELLILENQIKEKLSTNELALFLRFQEKILELKRQQDLELIQFVVDELEFFDR